jgi:ariadne-1
MIQFWEKKNNNEGENVKWLLVNTKQCPTCHKHIEKNQGCNHMTCKKEVGGCGYEFCWICLEDWKGHNNNYNCNKFDVTKDKDKAKIKTELDKYVHYFDRYINHRKSRDICKKNRLSIKNNIENLNKFFNLSYIETNFLEEGLNVVERGRRLLMNTYIFGFYMKEKSSFKLLFEHNQNLLEKHCDFLHEHLEDETLNKIIENPDFDKFNKEFTNFKSLITNYSNSTDKYLNNLITEIETKMMNEVVNYLK